MKNNFCSFALPLPRVIERYGDSTITCSDPTPLKLASSSGRYSCRADTSANALIHFQNQCRQNRASTYIPPQTCPRTGSGSGSDETGYPKTYYTCTGSC